jgi:hypothetical protein
LTATTGSQKEYTPFITNGIITVELTPERKACCQEVEVDQAEFLELTKNLGLNELSKCKSGDLFENFGYVFILELYDISDEYQKKHNLYYKTRAYEHNPIYSEKFGSIHCAWTQAKVEVV